MKSSQPRPNEDDDIDPAEIEAAADETPTAAGIAAPRVVPEDETSIAEQLVYEGTDEADRDRRLAAADPDFEP